MDTSNLTFEEIFRDCPFIRQSVEGRIAEEIGKKDQEIQQLKEEKNVLAQNVLDLTTVVEAILTGGIE